MRYLIADVETTGVTEKDEVIELYAVEIDADGNRLRDFYAICNPTVPVHPKAAEKNGWPKKWKSVENTIAGCKERFNWWAKGGTFQLINWHPSFDLMMLQSWAMDFKFVKHPIDIYSLVLPHTFDMELKDEKRGYPTLEEVYDHLIGRMQGKKPDFHTAVGDVNAVHRLYLYALARASA